MYARESSAHFQHTSTFVVSAPVRAWSQVSANAVMGGGTRTSSRDATAARTLAGTATGGSGYTWPWHVVFAVRAPPVSSLHGAIRLSAGASRLLRDSAG